MYLEFKAVFTPVCFVKCPCINVQLTRDQLNDHGRHIHAIKLITYYLMTNKDTLQVKQPTTSFDYNMKDYNMKDYNMKYYNMKYYNMNITT